MLNIKYFLLQNIEYLSSQVNFKGNGFFTVEIICLSLGCAVWKFKAFNDNIITKEHLHACILNLGNDMNENKLVFSFRVL